MIISRKRFEAEVQKRVDEAVCKTEERFWRNESERDWERYIAQLEERLIAVEKANGIDHPSHHRGKSVTASRW